MELNLALKEKAEQRQEIWGKFFEQIEQKTASKEDLGGETDVSVSKLGTRYMPGFSNDSDIGTKSTISHKKRRICKRIQRIRKRKVSLKKAVKNWCRLYKKVSKNKNEHNCKDVRVLVDRSIADSHIISTASSPNICMSHKRKNSCDSFDLIIKKRKTTTIQNILNEHVTPDTKRHKQRLCFYSEDVHDKHFEHNEPVVLLTIDDFAD